MKERKFPFYGTIGLILVAVFWFLNWYLDGLRTQLAFFPLWVGYSLTVNAFVYYRKGSSLISRNYKAFICLFLISAPAWWIFELLNLRTQNWFYDGKQYFSDLEFFLYSSLNFSTVVAAVFSSAELAFTFKWIQKLKPGPVIKPNTKNMMLFFISGIIMLLLLLIYPDYFFVFLWMSLFFIIEPINVWLNNSSLFDYIKNGNWKPVISLWTGVLICSFFWEMWNYYSYPKWIYRVPYVDFLHVFEMPLIGYLGYLPFSLELFALYHLVIGILGKNNLNDFVELQH